MIYVVLVGTEGEENLGLVARAMMNTGVEDLILVSPQCDYLSVSAMNYAIHAKEILRRAVVTDSLDKALEGMDLAVAMSRRIGQWRKLDFSLPEFAEYSRAYRDKKIALVFGREQSGLETSETGLCDLICSIPSSDKFPSLNLSHSVMVTLYALFADSEVAAKEVASRGEFDRMIRQIISALDELGFFKNVPSWRLKSYIGKVLLRSQLDSYDTNVITNLFKRIKGMTIKLKKQADKESE